MAFLEDSLPCLLLRNNSNLKKLFNIREGWQRADDTLPPRVLTETLPTGIVQGSGLTQADLDVMIHGYYTARGWTAEGHIPMQKLAELDLLEMVYAHADGLPVFSITT